MKHSKSKIATAYHEAGHAVAAWALHLPFRYVTIRPDEKSHTLGHIKHKKAGRSFRPDIQLTPENRWRIERDLIATFAGPEAEAKFTGRRNHVAATGDYNSAADLASRIHFDGEPLRLYLRLQQLAAQALVSQPWNWRAVRALATALLNRERISGPEARKIIIEATDPTKGR